MKYLFFYIGIFLIMACITREGQSDQTAAPIDTLIDISINDDIQKVLIQSDNIHNPILLYIHGGPGASAMMLSHYYSDSLCKYFTFVNWDQRGTGLSFGEQTDPTKITEKQIENDAIEIIKYLLQKFKQPKLYILGHSFGSIIGLRLASKYPDYFYAYIGVGQVIDWDKSVELTYHWLSKEMIKAKDYQALKELELNHFPSIEMIKKYRGHTYNPVNFDSIMRLSPYYFEGYIQQYLAAKSFTEYNIRKNPCPDCDSSSLYYLRNIEIPVYFLEGRHDHVMACAPELVVEFYEKLNAPKKKLIWFDNSAHLPNIEEPEKFQQVLIQILRNNFKTGA